MKCPKCGKRLRNNEKFCTVCGYFVGDISPDDLEQEEQEERKEKKVKEELQEERILSETLNEKTRQETTDDNLDDDFQENTEFQVKDSSGTRKNEYSYENEDLLEAYIGEDYKLIKNSIFNFWAFLLNWMYLLYRKLYITGAIGLIVTWLVVMFLRKYFLIYLGIIMIVLGFGFNPYYIMVAKKRVEKIKDNTESNDRFELANTCKEKGGVNVLLALIVYFVFLVIVFFSIISFTINKNHNTKFWKENSENLASCTSIVKTAYTNIEETKDRGELKDAVCKVLKNKEYEVYVKTELDGKTIYSYYSTENGYVSYKENTLQMNELEIQRGNGTINQENKDILTRLKKIETTYQDTYMKAQKEEDLIKRKKNTEARTSFIFTTEEIIR